MPGEVYTGGHWVLHCDSRADRPIRVSIFPRLPRIDEDRGPRRRVLKDRRQQIEIRAREARLTSDHRDGKSFSVLDSSVRIPRIGDREEKVLSTDRASQSLRRRRRGDGLLAYLATRGSPPAIENARERPPVTWKSQESEEKERVESRLHDVETKSDPAIAGSIAGRRSLQDRSQTRHSRSTVRHKTNLDAYPGRTRITEESSLLSSHRSRTRSNEDDLQDVEGHLGERLDDARPDENARLKGHDERSETERIERLGQNRKRIGNRRAYRVRSFLQLAFLLFLVAFGRCGLGSSGVIKFSARPTASVLGFGAFIRAVSAGTIDLTGDAGTRAERSANLSHITGASRKIQMYIKNRHLQILPDGTVNGSNDDTSDYSEYFLMLSHSIINHNSYFLRNHQLINVL